MRLAWTTTLVTGLLAEGLGAQSRVLKLPSQVLGETKVVHVNLPRDYAIAKQRYPVIVLLDGQVRAFYDMTVAAADYDLTGDGFAVAMPRQIVVAVEHGSRAADLGSNADAFLRFLTAELLPKIDKDYRTLPYRTLIGHSRGGWFALRAMCREPTAFPAVIAISPSISDTLETEVSRCIAGDTVSRAQRTLVLSAGSLETRALTHIGRLLTTVRPALPAHWRVEQTAAAGLEHTGAPLAGIPLGLRVVFDAQAWDLPQPWRDSLALKQGEPERVLAAGLAEQSRRVGFTMPASARLMSAVVQTWLARLNGERAVAAAKALVLQYPEEILSHTLLADAYDLAGDTLNGTRAIQAALEMSTRIVWFDETQKGRFQVEMRRLLQTRTP